MAARRLTAYKNRQDIAWMTSKNIRVAEVDALSIVCVVVDDDLNIVLVVLKDDRASGVLRTTYLPLFTNTSNMIGSHAPFSLIPPLGAELAP